MKLIDKISSDFPVGNAAGHCKTLEEVVVLAKSAAEFIVVGSITISQRDGNPGNTFNNINLNALGLPNPGAEYIRRVGPEMVKVAHAAGKLIFLSVAGFTPEEFLVLAKVAYEAGFDGVQLNLGCPNIVEGEKRKPIFSFYPDLITAIIQPVTEWARTLSAKFFVTAKMSYYSNPLQLVDTAELIASLGVDVDAVVTQNTLPNALLFNEDGTPQIQTPDKTGLAGHSGRDIKPDALGQVFQWRKALDACGAQAIPVIGVGGVQEGKDVRDMFRAGASAVEVGTTYFLGGAKVFGEIANQYVNL